MDEEEGGEEEEEKRSEHRKVICSPWAHPSGIQQHKLNLYQHQHIITPRTWIY